MIKKEIDTIFWLVPNDGLERDAAISKALIGTFVTTAAGAALTVLGLFTFLMRSCILSSLRCCVPSEQNDYLDHQFSRRGRAPNQGGGTGPLGVQMAQLRPQAGQPGVPSAPELSLLPIRALPLDNLGRQGVQL